MLWYLLKFLAGMYSKHPLYFWLWCFGIDIRPVLRKWTECQSERILSKINKYSCFIDHKILNKHKNFRPFFFDHLLITAKLTFNSTISWLLTWHGLVTLRIISTAYNTLIVLHFGQIRDIHTEQNRPQPDTLLSICQVFTEPFLRSTCKTINLNFARNSRLIVFKWLLNNLADIRMQPCHQQFILEDHWPAWTKLWQCYSPWWKHKLIVN